MSAIIKPGITGKGGRNDPKRPRPSGDAKDEGMEDVGGESLSTATGSAAATAVQL